MALAALRQLLHNWRPAGVLGVAYRMQRAAPRRQSIKKSKDASVVNRAITALSDVGGPDLRGTGSMEKGLQAAVRRFPERRHEVLRLAFADGSFRALCDDLAEAESALGRWARSGACDSARRCSEYDDLVKELASEIEQFLENQSNKAAPHAE